MQRFKVYFIDYETGQVFDKTLYYSQIIGNQTDISACPLLLHE